MTSWGKGPTGLTERVRRDRIRVAVAAWAYENNHKPTMSDSAYDELALRVQKTLKIATGTPRLDKFFRRHFTPDTGLWVHKHPNPAGLENIYARYHQPVLKRKRRKRRR